MSTTANCAIGSGFAVQDASFGLSGGSGAIEETCTTIEQAKAAQGMGDAATAQVILCSLPKVREARKHVGRPCWADLQPVVAAEHTDPCVRARLGLPALN